MTVEEFRATRPPGTRCRDCDRPEMVYRILRYGVNYTTDIVVVEFSFAGGNPVITEWGVSLCLDDSVVQDFESALEAIVEAG